MFEISEVQARHYAAQFAQLRPERGLLSGQTARLDIFSFQLVYRIFVNVYETAIGFTLWNFSYDVGHQFLLLLRKN